MGVAREIPKTNWPYFASLGLLRTRFQYCHSVSEEERASLFFAKVYTFGFLFRDRSALYPPPTVALPARGRRLAFGRVRTVMAEQERQNLSWTLFLIYLGLAAIVLYGAFNNESIGSKRVSYSEFLTAVENGKLENVRVTNSDFIGALKKTDNSAQTSTISTPRLPATDESWLMNELRDDHVQIIAEP